MPRRSRSLAQTFRRSFVHLSIWFGLVALWVTTNAVGVLLSSSQWRMLP